MVKTRVWGSNSKIIETFVIDNGLTSCGKGVSLNILLRSIVSLRHVLLKPFTLLWHISRPLRHNRREVSCSNCCARIRVFGTDLKTGLFSINASLLPGLFTVGGPREFRRKAYVGFGFPWINNCSAVLILRMIFSSSVLFSYTL